MGILFKQTIKKRLFNLLAYCLLATLFLWFYVALFPYFSRSFGELKGYLDFMPKGFLEAVGIDPQVFFTFEGYVGSEQFTFIWPIMAILLLVSWASWAVAEETDKKTFSFLFSQPISRGKIFLAKYLAGLLGLLVFVVISVGAIFPLTKFYQITINHERFLKLMLLEFLFGWVVLSLSMFWAVVFSEKLKANLASGGLLILMYFLKIFSELKEKVAFLKYFSFFYYLNPTKLLVYGELEKGTWLLFSFLALGLLGLAFFWFNKRDFVV